MPRAASAGSVVTVTINRSHRPCRCPSTENGARGGSRLGYVYLIVQVTGEVSLPTDKRGKRDNANLASSVDA